MVVYSILMQLVKLLFFFLFTLGWWLYNSCELYFANTLALVPAHARTRTFTFPPMRVLTPSLEVCFFVTTTVDIIGPKKDALLTRNVFIFNLQMTPFP